MRKKRSARQWKVVPGIHVNELERTLDRLEAQGWGIFQIIGPAGNLAIIATRRLVRP